MRISDWSSDVCSSDLVSATLVNDGQDPPQHYMLLTAKNTGEDAAIASITVSAADANPSTDVSQVQSLMAYDKAAGTGAFTETAAKNAAISINGIAIESQSNTIKDTKDRKNKHMK